MDSNQKNIENIANNNLLNENMKQKFVPNPKV